MASMSLRLAATMCGVGSIKTSSLLATPESAACNGPRLPGMSQCANFSVPAALQVARSAMSSIPVSGSSSTFPVRAVSSKINTEVSAASPLEEPELETDPITLWNRYVDWLYQDKELGLYLDVSRVGFTQEFYETMLPRFEQAFKHMEELEGGSIANPDEGRMVGHYWLRKAELAPTPFLQKLISDTLDKVESFANDVISAKVQSTLTDPF
jgi:glucose-6-phosphate isomerase